MPLRKEVDKSVAIDDDASPSSSSAARNQVAPAPRAFAPPPPPASSRGAGPAPAPAAAPAPAPGVARPTVASAPSAARVQSESADSEEEAAPRETLVQRADRLFTQGRWAEAAIAYRDLLRQRPNAPEASQWRKRLAASRAAIATGRPPSSR